MKQQSVFATDKLRQRLAEEKKIDELARTYDGSLPDLPTMNNPGKWDFRANNMARMVNDKLDAHNRKRIETIAKLVDCSRKTLDFGVGPGDILPYLIKRNPSIDYTGIDIAKNFIDRLTTLFPAHKFFCKNIAEIESGSFEQILALEVLEHIEIPALKNIFLQIRRILTDQGNLVISVPLFEKLEEITLCCSQCGSLENTAGHVRAFTPQLVFAELELAGFKVKEYRCVWLPAKNRIRNILKRMLRPILKDKPVTLVVRAEKKSLAENRFPAYKKSEQSILERLDGE